MALSFVKETVIDIFQAFRSKGVLKNLYSSSLYRNGAFLIVTTGITMVFGFGFWIVTARFYSPEDVGVASAVISVVGLLSFVGTMGLGFGIIRYLPGSGSKSSLLNSTFTLATMAATAAAICFVIGLPVLAPGLTIIRENLFLFGLVFILIVFSTLSELTNQIFVAFRRADFSLANNIIAGSVRLGLAAGLCHLFQVFGIFVYWGAGIIIAFIVSICCFLHRLLPQYVFLPSLRTRLNGAIIRFSMVNYLSSLLWRLPGWILPLMVLHLISAEANAYFYMAWTMSGILLGISVGAATSLFAEGSHRLELLSYNLKQTLKLTFSLLIPAVIIFVLFADELLILFGTEYSRAGGSLFSILAIASLPTSLNSIYLGVVRVEKRLKDIIMITASPALGTFVLSYLLIPHLGIFGTGIGWLVSQSAVALVIAPRIIKRLSCSGATGAISVVGSYE